MAGFKVSRSVKTESRLKTALYYSVELLVDVLILYVFIKAFAMSFNFAYDVFHDSAKNPGDRSYVVVKIEPYSSAKKISNQLYDAGVIENKYVMMLRIKIGEYGDRIKAGKYGVSASMTYEEILNVLTGNATTEEEDDTGGDKASETDAIDPNEIHDNSDMGAGEGAAEGGDSSDEGAGEGEATQPDDGGDSGEGGGE